MLTIALVSQKGGSGKTTLALHLAVASVHAGRHAAIIDFDPQASAAHWADRREAALPTVLAAPASRLRPRAGSGAGGWRRSALPRHRAPLRQRRAQSRASGRSGARSVPHRHSRLGGDHRHGTISRHHRDASLRRAQCRLPARPRCRSSRGRAPHAHPGRVPRPRRPPRGLCTGAADRLKPPRNTTLAVKLPPSIEHLHAFLMKRVHNSTPSQSGVLAND